jgi:hypothetical protein
MRLKRARQKGEMRPACQRTLAGRLGVLRRAIQSTTIGTNIVCQNNSTTLHNSRGVFNQADSPPVLSSTPRQYRDPTRHEPLTHRDRSACVGRQTVP